MQARVGDVDRGAHHRGGALVIARGGFGLWAGDVDGEELERELRIDARDRARARCEDHAPRCAHCRGRGGYSEYDPEGRPLGGWEHCDACDGTGVSSEPPRPSVPVCTPTTCSSVVTDFGADDVPF